MKKMFSKILTLAICMCTIAGVATNVSAAEKYTVDHVCSFEHVECVEKAEELGIELSDTRAIPHCAYGNVTVRRTTTKTHIRTENCIHGAVGKVDNIYLVETYDIYSCSGCSYYERDKVSEETIRVCG